MGEVSSAEFYNNLKRGQDAFKRINLPEDRVREIVKEEIAKVADEIRKRVGKRL